MWMRKIGWIAWIVGFVFFCVSFAGILVLQRANLKAHEAFANFDADAVRTGRKAWNLTPGDDSPRASLVAKVKVWGWVVPIAAALSILLFLVCALPKEVGPRVIAAVGITASLFLLGRALQLDLIGKALA